MKRRLLSVMLCIMLVLSCAPTALAVSDTTPPELISVSVNKTEFSVGETVVFTVKAKDSESGLDSCRLDLQSQYKGLSFSLVPQSDGETLIGEVTLDKDNYQSGDYQLTQVYLNDKSDNMIYYRANNTWNEARMLPPEMIITLHITNNDRTDWEGPVLQSLKADKTVVNAGDTIYLEATASDPSGLSGYGSGLQGPKSLNVHLSPIEGSPNKLSGSVTIPATYPSGTYVCDGGILFDKLYNATIYSSNPTESEKRTPDAAQVSIKVTGSQQVTSNVNVTDIQFSPKVVKQGEPIDFRITLEDGGHQINSFGLSIAPKIWADLHSRQIGVDMTKVSEGVYECSIVPPANWPVGDYVISEMMWGEDETGSYPDWNGRSFNNLDSDDCPSFAVVSVFAGTDNTSILVGSPAFDPMAGVSAANGAEGDLTGKIEVTGSVDTTKPGVYLLKYRIPSMYTDPLTNQTRYYYDFRWVGVTEIMPPSNDPNAPLALTNDSLRVGAQASDVTVKRDGSKVSYASTYTTPGVYAISEKAGTASSAASALSVAGSLSSGASADSTANAVIDRKGPAVTAAWGKSGSSIKVSVKAADGVGVAQLKYKSGACKLADFKTGGKAFTGTFTVSKKGTYTVYAKDKLGNESVKQIKVTSSSTGFAYLSSIGVTGGKLSPGFSKKEYSYKISVGENQPNVTLKPVKEWEGASVTINGKAVSSAKISVGNGKTMKATVKVTYGDTSKTYKFSITRAKSTNNKLSDIKATAGKFNKAFSAGTTKYTLALDEKTSSTTIKAVTQNSKAEASPESVKVKLDKGESKTVKFTVKAQSGAKKTYSVTVKRAKSTSTKLEYIKTNSSKCPLSPAFDTGTSSYTVTLPADRSKVTLSAKAVSNYAGVKVDGSKGAKTFTLSSGQSITVKVVVTAQSGKKKEYTVTIKRL